MVEERFVGVYKFSKTGAASGFSGTDEMCSVVTALPHV